MLMIVGTVSIPSERLAAALPAMSAMVTASRSEVGCLAYSYAHDLLEPGRIHVIEQWRSQADLDAHFQTDHIAVWRKAWSTLGIRDRTLTLYDVSNARET